MEKVNRLLFVFGMLGMYAVSATAGQVTGRSFFQPRVPLFMQLVPFANHADYEVAQASVGGLVLRSQECSEGVGGFGFTAAAGYQASTNDRRFASYFLPHGKNNLTIKGANASGDCDISAMWLQIVGENTVAQPAPIFGARDPAHIFDRPGDAAVWLNQYASTISLNPHFSSAYAITQLYYNQYVGRIPCQLAFSIPVLKTRNTLQLREGGVQHAYSNRTSVPRLLVYDDTDADIIQVIQPQYSLSAHEAFSNPAKRYGKISDRPRELRGIGDVSIDLRVQPAPSVTIGVRGELPTAPKGTAEYLFEPLLGSNGHGTLGLYATLHETLWRWEQMVVDLKAHLQYQAQLPGTELRTFDLAQAGPWSRYLLLIDAGNNPLNPVSGVNVLTRPVRVATRSQATAGVSLQAGFQGFSASVGYGVFVREKERLAMRGELPANIFIAGQVAPLDLTKVPSRAALYAAPKNISISEHIAVFKDAFGDPTEPANAGLALTNSDLDLQSAAMPHYFSHELQATLGFAGTLNEQEVHLRLGGSYEWLQTGRSFDVFSVFGALTVKI
ncbi:hypothetical protein FJ365_05105 [Candidatus Dependentiae bacterium]|nr:hypothetical protein [Candidatus Dependentiae bacterium]